MTMIDRPVPCLRRAWPAALALLTACGGSGVRPIVESRTVDAETSPIRWNVSDAERFGLEEGPRPPRFVYQLPEGWTELPPSEFREANFGIEAYPDIDCYVSLVTGGAFANLNRWRGQMGLEPMSEAEVQSLPKEDFLGTEAFYVEMDGTFSGMLSDPQPGFTLAGLLIQTPQGEVTFKLIGPSEGVRAELERFLALAASFRIAGGPGGGGSAGTSPSSGQAAGGGGNWKVPEGWRKAPDRAMRDVTFSVGESTECWVSTLGGDGGGEAMNIQRWRNEMGNAPLARQEPIDMLGGRGILLEIRGNYGGGRGGSSIPDAVMLATMRFLPDRAVFVKMIGPRAEVEANRNQFVQFCTSLR